MRLGCLYGTKKVDSLMRKNNQFSGEINEAINKFVNNNWGDTCIEDRLLNDLALVTGERIVAVYLTIYGPVWIISEYDRQATTILFPSEY
ncbi:MAG: hypothetical protein AB7V16_11295 [Vulcanibacillus sp.]